MSKMRLRCWNLPRNQACKLFCHVCNSTIGDESLLRSSQLTIYACVSERSGLWENRPKWHWALWVLACRSWLILWAQKLQWWEYSLCQEHMQLLQHSSLACGLEIACWLLLVGRLDPKYQRLYYCWQVCRSQTLHNLCDRTAMQVDVLSACIFDYQSALSFRTVRQLSLNPDCCISLPQHQKSFLAGHMIP